MILFVIKEHCLFSVVNKNKFKNPIWNRSLILQTSIEVSEDNWRVCGSWLREECMYSVSVKTWIMDGKSGCRDSSWEAIHSSRKQEFIRQRLKDDHGKEKTEKEAINHYFGCVASDKLLLFLRHELKPEWTGNTFFGKSVILDEQRMKWRNEISRKSSWITNWISDEELTGKDSKGIPSMTEILLRNTKHTENVTSKVSEFDIAFMSPFWCLFQFILSSHFLDIFLPMFLLSLYFASFLGWTLEKQKLTYRQNR